MAITLNGSTGIVSANIADGTIAASDLASGAAKTNYGSIATSDLPSGTVLRTYTAYNPSAVSGVGTTPFDIGINFTNVVINAGEAPILFLHVTSRSTGGTQHHCALRLRYTGSATGVVGNGTWGFGIMQGAGWDWLITSVSGVNLKQIRAPFNSTGTFNFYTQAVTNSGSSPLVFGGESNSASVDYGYLSGTIMIVKE